MRNTNRKALFFDIDGTLMGRRNFVPDSTKRALTRARELGHLVFINTGRTYRLAMSAAERFETDGLLCGCGTEIIIGKDSVYQYVIPEATTRELMSDSRIMKFDLCLEGHEGDIFSEDLRLEDTIRLARYTELEGALLKEGLKKGFRANKFCVQGDELTDMGAFVEKYGRDFEIIDRAGKFYECVPAGHSKATAIDFVLERYDIPREDAYAFGDSANDIPMLKAVNAVIMGEHDREIEKYADFVTKRLEEDGIEYAMKSLSII